MIILDIFLMSFSIFSVIFILKNIAKKKIGILAFTLYILSFLYVFRAVILLLGIDYPHTRFFLHQDYMILVRYGLALFILWIWILALSYTISIPVAYWLKFLFPKFSKKNVINLVFINQCIIFIDLAIIVMMIIKAQSISVLFNTARLGDTLLGMKFLIHFPYLGSLFSACCIIIYLMNRKRGDKNNRLLKYSLIVLILGVAYSVLINERSGIVLPLIVLGIQYVYFLMKKIPLVKIIIISVLVLVVLIFLYVARLNLLMNQNYSFDLYSIRYSWTHLVFVSINSTSFDNFLLILQDYSSDNYRRGEDFILGLKSIVPRALWKNKPISVHPGEILRKNYIRNSRSGWPLTVIGQWYINFGFIGVIIGAFISGIFLRTVNEVYKRVDTAFTIMVLFIISNHVFIGGVIVQSLMLYILWIVPLYIISIITSRRFVVAK